MYSIEQYSTKKGISKSYVYRLIKSGKLESKVINGVKYIIELNSDQNSSKVHVTSSLELEKENIKLSVENEFIKKENEKLKKENEELKYQVKNKDFEIKSLLEKLENLNDRVIGLIEWKNTSWLNRFFKRKV